MGAASKKEEDSRSSADNKFEVYVYDTERIQSEYDDPLEAVLFHHPPGLSPEHVLVTAGQLAGVAQFFSITLGEDPKVGYFENCLASVFPFPTFLKFY